MSKCKENLFLLESGSYCVTFTGKRLRYFYLFLTLPVPNFYFYLRKLVSFKVK